MPWHICFLRKMFDGNDLHCNKIKRYGTLEGVFSDIIRYHPCCTGKGKGDLKSVGVLSNGKEKNMRCEEI